ncbi:menaquinone biosynthesis family protein [Candidatus Omnitrophota bacterium]
MNIRIGHTPDADDAFMFYAMLNKKIDVEGLSFEDVLEPITKLNAKAVQSVYDMTALSVGFLAHVADKYDILASGACMAEERGPLLVTRKNAELKNIAVPGLNTTAYFALKLYNKEVTCHVLPFDRILNHLQQGTIDGGVLISEDQMRINRNDVDWVDLGQWWRDKTGFPLPLGVDGVRSDIPCEVKQTIGRVFKRSIEYARDNEREVLQWAIKFARGIDEDNGLAFIKTFVNNFTVDMGDRGRQAIRNFVDACFNARLIKERVELTFIGEEER